MNYTTQMDAAKKGIITREMEIVAAKIAAHAGDIAKGVKGAREIDNKMDESDFEW